MLKVTAILTCDGIDTDYCGPKEPCKTSSSTPVELKIKYGNIFPSNPVGWLLHENGDGMCPSCLAEIMPKPDVSKKPKKRPKKP